MVGGGRLAYRRQRTKRIVAGIAQNCPDAAFTAAMIISTVVAMLTAMR